MDFNSIISTIKTRHEQKNITISLKNIFWLSYVDRISENQFIDLEKVHVIPFLFDDNTLSFKNLISNENIYNKVDLTKHTFNSKKQLVDYLLSHNANINLTNYRISNNFAFVDILESMLENTSSKYTPIYTDRANFKNGGKNPLPPLMIYRKLM